MRRTNTLARKNGIIKQSALFAGVGKKTPRYWRVNERSFFFFLVVVYLVVFIFRDEG